jgi:protein SCO1/2
VKVFLFILCLSIGMRAGAQDPPLGVLQNISIDQKLNEAVPLELEFRDETGRPVRLHDYFGEKPVILSLVYYDCPMLCTLVLNGLLRSLRALQFDAGKEFNVVAVSFDPRNTPEMAALKRQVYIDEYRRPGAAGGWHFLTGKQESIERLTDAVGFRYKYDPESRQWAHASAIMVLTPEGRLSQYFYGIEYSARDLRLSLVEAAANRIGSPVDKVLLYCYHYDPATGKYGLVIMNVLRIAGLGTVLALGGFVTLMIHRENSCRRGLWGCEKNDGIGPDLGR